MLCRFSKMGDTLHRRRPGADQRPTRLPRSPVKLPVESPPVYSKSHRLV
jgi:hypothetical protein